MSLTFADNLWAGIKVVYDRFDTGKDTVGTILAFLKERIKVEEEYSKNLEKLVTKSAQIPEKGTLGNGWTAFKSFHENAYKQHSIVLTQLQTSVFQPLAALKKDQEKARDNLKSEQQKLDSNLAKGREALAKAKQKYQKACRDLENSTLQLKALEDPSNLNAKPKEVTKVRQQNATDRQGAEQAHEAYKQQIKEFNQTQKKYEEGMRHILEQFQDLETKRIQKVREVCLEFHRTQDTIVTSYKEHLPGLKEGITAINESTDLQEFLNANNTNEKPEALASYEPFVSEKGIDVPADRSFAPGGEGSAGSMSARAQSARFNPATVKAAVESAKTDAPPALTPPPVEDGEKTPKKSGRKDKDKTEEGSKSPRLKTSKSAKKLKDGEKGDDSKVDKSNDGPAAGTEPKEDTKKSPREAKPETPKGETKKARALFDYDAADETEISFKTDDIITVVPSADPMEGWLEGEINGNRGLFPENYVEIIGEEGKASADAAEKPAASSGGKTRQCIALYDFVAENEDELTIKEGEELMVEEESDGWCTGTNKEGKTGLFPANYVEDKKE